MTESALSAPSAATAAWQFDGVVRFTRVGSAFMFFTIVIGFAAINTGNNSLYIGLSFMLGCLLLSGVASKGGLKHLVIEFDGIDEAWAGRRAHGRLRIVNRSSIWNIRDIIISSDEMSTPLFIPMIARRETITAEATFFFRKRGIVQLKRVDLYTRYPFGFFLKKRRARMSGEVVVYPRLLDGDIAPERFRSVEGELHSSNRLGPGGDIHSFRDFASGDSLRHVYWKKSASLGRWIIKQTEVEAARAVHVVVDPYKPRTVSDNTFEEMISEAATFLDHALRRGLDVLFSVPHLTLRSDGEGAAAMFRTLALLQPTHEPVAQTVERNSMIFSAGSVDDVQSA